jgi:hypothetical protein
MSSRACGRLDSSRGPTMLEIGLSASIRSRRRASIRANVTADVTPELADDRPETVT